MQNSFRLTAGVALVSLAAAAAAEVSYRVTPLIEAKRLKVEMTVPTIGVETLIQFPEWAPGHYVLEKYAKNLKDFAAVDSEGRSTGFVVVDDHTWRVPGINGGRVTVSYTVPALVSDGAWHYSGPQVYAYAVGRTAEPCRLEIAAPKGWPILTGLNGDGPTFAAKTYDVLADNPVSMGTLLVDTYTVKGKPHFIALRGAAATQVDRARLTKICHDISEAQTTYFGGAPYDKYVWHFSVYAGNDGAGGLEHLSSTEISLASAVGPATVSVLSHEFFHLWNVKRIRSRVLGPFDYTQLPQTGALWWMEGVDDYLSNLLLRRYEIQDDKVFLPRVGAQVTSQRARPARLTVSPYEASYRVRDAANGRGNSDGFGVSYYNTGFLVGMCLDLELLARTDGRRSLDDVEHALWQMCRDDQPGFEEEEIRRQLIRFGGESMGAVYDRLVLKAGELPVETQLQIIGMQLGTESVNRVDVGIATTASAEAHGMKVTTAAPGLPEETVILAVDGQAITGTTAGEIRRSWLGAIAKAKAGTALTLRVRRPGESADAEVSVMPKVVATPRTTLVPVENPTPQALKLRQIWLARRRG